MKRAKQKVIKVFVCSREFNATRKRTQDLTLSFYKKKKNLFTGQLELLNYFNKKNKKQQAYKPANIASIISVIIDN